MKKVLLLACVFILISTSAIYAQPEKGDWMVGASLVNANGYINSTVPHQFSFNLNPSAGYFLSNRVAIGTGLNLGYGVFGSRNYFLNVGLSPFARYYFVPKEGMQAKKLFLFGELSTQVGVTNYVDKVGNINTTNSGFNAGVGAGLGYLIAPNVSIEGLLKINHYSSFQGVSNQPFGLQPSLGIGFQIYLRGKKKAAAVTE